MYLNVGIKLIIYVIVHCAKKLDGASLIKIDTKKNKEKTVIKYILTKRVKSKKIKNKILFKQ